MKNYLLIAFALLWGACTEKYVAPKYDGAQLWLQNNLVGSSVVVVEDSTEMLHIAKKELQQLSITDSIVLRLAQHNDLGNEGFEVSQIGRTIIAEANTQNGLLYAAFYLRRADAMGQSYIAKAKECPAYAIRILNHWDNIDGTIERGFAGHSIWKWNELPDSISTRYAQYARANASVGINMTVLNNVNASPQILSTEFIAKIKALADIFRPYGIRVCVSVNFSSPMALGGLSTADPLNKDVREWWKAKIAEIYASIPDFGGFLVKANSEGLPGPLDFGRSHADGANMFAEFLKPFGGIVMWRAFVYSPSDADRAKQALLEFEPLDGQFADNVIIQTKNGPIDFQPREPFSPLFGRLNKTRQMCELQITQEYTGAANHMCFLPAMWKETLDAETYATPSPIKQRIEALAGVANIGDAANWTEHPFAQANWYAFGRLAWNPDLSVDSLAIEWTRQSLGLLPQQAEQTIVKMLSTSRETIVDYMMPIGLHHIFAWGHHYGPEPWCMIKGARPDWLPSYYHRADSIGVGFDRSPSGSSANTQYNAPLDSIYGNIESCPDELLLWFHHVSWNHVMHSGRTMWNELCYRYKRGIDATHQYLDDWLSVRNYVDEKLWTSVNNKLIIQNDDAKWWHDACLLYFQQFSKLEIPRGTTYNLEDMMSFRINISNYECPEKGYRSTEK